ncbi:MAG: helix-turn-helix transcriptional regulator [Bacilli bacterium]
MNELKKYRLFLGKTQQEFAEVLGITRFAYSNKERGIRFFKDSEKKTITKYINSLGIEASVESLFFSEDITQKD